MNITNSRISLSREDSKALLEALTRPSAEYLEKRDAFLKETENWTITEENGWITAEIPDWNPVPKCHSFHTFNQIKTKLVSRCEAFTIKDMMYAKDDSILKEREPFGTKPNKELFENEIVMNEKTDAIIAA